LEQELPVLSMIMIKQNNFYTQLCSFLTFSLLLAGGTSAISQSIQFNQGSWKEALALSKSSQKIIFVDVYTHWCGPCKKMDQEVFSKKKVAGYFNQHFINFKIDADTEEGRAFKEQYEVGAYPTFLFIREDGSLMWKESGYQETEDLLALGEKMTMLKNDPELNTLTKAYLEGKKDKDFLIRYMQLRKERLKTDNSEVLTRFIAQLDSADLYQPASIKVIADYFSRANTVAFDLMMEQYEQIIKNEWLTIDPSYLEAIDNQQRQLDQLPANQVFNASPEILRQAIVRQCFDERMDEALNNCFAIAVKQTNNGLFDTLILKHFQFNKLAKRRNTPQRNDQLKVRFYRQTEQAALYAKAAEFYINTYILPAPVNIIASTDSLRKHTAAHYLSDSTLAEVLGKKEAQQLKHLRSQSRKLSTRSNARLLIQTANEFCEFFEEEKALLKAVAWVEQAIQLYEEPLHYLAYAQLINKLGDQALALRLIDRGLQLTEGHEQEQVRVSSSTRKKEARQLKRFRDKMLNPE